MTALAAAPADATTPGGFLLVLAVILPVIAILAMVAFGPRQTGRLAIITIGAGIAVALAIVAELIRTEAAVGFVVGNWQPPLGLALRADGLSAAMLAMTALVIAAIGSFAHIQHGLDPATRHGRAPTTFWILLMAIWSALNAVFLGEDLFNLYVALELLTFAAVPLVCLDGRAETVAAALRYLLFALLGSLLYLLGTALIYGSFGTLDIGQLSAMDIQGPGASLALALMIAGLLAKAALFPLHIWLPPAHAGAPAAASAVLSALVIKAPFFLILRLVLDVAPPGFAAQAGQLLAILGAASILFCSVVALRQARLKLMIAYSTVAQIGYLFIVFPLAARTGTLPPWETIAWTGGALQLISHALAKAAMFLAAGAIAEAFGHDRIADLGGFGRALPISATAFGLAGMSLMGLPPSGGFVAKCLLLTAAVTGSHPFLAATILAGGLLAGGYVFRVVNRALATPAVPLAAVRPVPRRLELAALVLALAAVLMGFVPLQPLGFLQLGRIAPMSLVAP
ncbi:complex I subunit 5 family protein [Aurantimonas endophytica]|uniref:Formate hydrogenlyase subunit 3/multisubunit Na+/H+ antiporter MnhD subunit n=1 Tax=Aurantimonas endophytica TaxID=1522175 RepID=A0A7W6HDG2_9HYPH|nr:proton-conducting transporter membrane subunit [Aurantimonas endophytica]MBB4003012.1 formate hydrogenlyase subunit 3/multisubunit Na+/H+ antiporter MnhD subunit [Aurantimonas endophytica]MCO6403887.1 NADH-quinone oxidoreductase subunit J [Aurantimonas endophytica]